MWAFGRSAATRTLLRRQVSLSKSLCKRDGRCALFSTAPATDSTSSSSSGGNSLYDLANKFPHMDAVRYHHKNLKFSFKKVEFYSNCLATGLLETGLTRGDIILSWLPSHFAEEHILQFACSKAGFVLYNLDPALAITDRDAAKEALKEALLVTNANVLISQEAGDDVNYVRIVKEVIPETTIFDFGEGLPFFTPRFPHLRFPVHTGFSSNEGDKLGFAAYKYFMSPSTPRAQTLLPEGTVIDGTTPLKGELILDSKGIPQSIGETMTNEQVRASGIWPTYNAILEKQYTEVEGVGVIF